MQKIVKGHSKTLLLYSIALMREDTKGPFVRPVERKKVYNKGAFCIYPLGKAKPAK